MESAIPFAQSFHYLVVLFLRHHCAFAVRDQVWKKWIKDFPFDTGGFLNLQSKFWLNGKRPWWPWKFSSLGKLQCIIYKELNPPLPKKNFFGASSIPNFGSCMRKYSMILTLYSDPHSKWL